MFTIKYNRTTNHIGGLNIRTESGGDETGGVVADYSHNACGSLTRYRFADGKSFESLAEALESARKGGRKLCKTCEKAAESQIAAEAATVVPNSEEALKRGESEDMPKKGARQPWRVSFQYASQDKPSAKAHYTREEADRFAEELTETASQRDTTVTIEITNRDTGAREMVSAVNRKQNERDVNDICEEIESNIDRARSLAEAENTEALAELSEETESLISSLPTRGKIGDKTAAQTKKEYRDSFRAAATVQERPAEVAKKAAEGTVAPKSWDQYDGVSELVTMGAEKIAEGVRAHVKTSHIAKDVAAVVFDMWLRIPNKDGNPDLIGSSDPAKKATTRLIEIAGEGFEDNFDNRDALKKLLRSMQTQRTDVRAAWLRSLDEDTDEGAERRALLSGVLENKPEDVSASEYAANYYRVGLKGEIEKARDRYNEQKAIESGEAAEESASEDTTTPDERITALIKKLSSDVKKAKPEDFEAASEQTKDAARKTLEELNKAVKAMIAATL